MESENVHYQQQHQDQLVASSPLPCYGVSWTPNAPSFTLNNNDQFNPNYNATPSNSMIQEWSSTSSSHDQQLDKIKEEHNHNHNHMHDLSQKLLLKTISSGFPMFPPAGEFNYSPTQNCSSVPIRPTRGSFSQIYPSINISNLNQTSSPNIPNSFDVNLDLLNPTRFSRSSSFNQLISSHDDHSPSFGLQHTHQSNHTAGYGPSKKCFLNDGFPSDITDAKRPSTLPERKATTAGTAKKLRLESRASCPPIKVRKEKLGDRIAALQQLVAPFGKTDTASVLLEAIGYIKFLQNQVETLSVPYMKVFRNKTSRSRQGGSTAEEGNEEPKRDLRSRGLCLVPLSCMSYMTNDSGGGIWPPPNFGGGT